MTLALIDYGAGNLHSVENALRTAGCTDLIVTADADVVAKADRIVLPGVGAYGACAAALRAVPGMVEALNRRVRDEGAPFLGICVGMQLMAERGLEHGETQGFGWIRGEIARMQAPRLRLPHMGWNELGFTPGAHPLTEGLARGDHGYFVHSYALSGHDPADVIASAEYGGAVPAIVARGNRAGTQFHVEKSQSVGLRILANFLRWAP